MSCGIVATPSLGSNSYDGSLPKPHVLFIVEFLQFEPATSLF